VKFTFDSILSGSVKTPKRGAFELVRSVEVPDAGHGDLSPQRALRIFPLGPYPKPGIGIVPHGIGQERQRCPPDWHRVLSASSAKSRTKRLCWKEIRAISARCRRSHEVRFRIVPDAIVRALELRKGSADMELSSLGPDTVVALGKQPGLVADVQPGTNLAYIAFNFDDPTLARREVRQALAYATDRQSLIKYLLRDQARARVEPAASRSLGLRAERSASTNTIPHARAQLLDAAGLPRSGWRRAAAS
jgi:peptide/nickel transport system substrate-binding protein